MSEPTGSYESIVAKIAADPEFRQNLLDNTRAAIEKAGLTGEVTALRNSGEAADEIACALTCGGVTCVVTCHVTLI